MKKTIIGITWAAIEHLFYLIPIIVLTGISIIVLLRKKEVMAGKLVARQWQGIILKHYSDRKNKIKAFLLSFSILFIALALLQPQWGAVEKKIEQEGRELFVALDISRSMLAADIKPNRLTFAKAKIKRLLQLLPSERVGLVIFSGTAVVQCPLTRDTSLFNLFLDYLDVETISSGTTAIDQVIKKVVDIFKKLPARKDKLLVIFTDGEDFSHNLAQVKQEAQQLGLHVFTYGVGTAQGAPIPIIDVHDQVQGYEKNEQGNVVLSILNEGILQSLSEQTGAYYIAPTQSDDDLKKLVNKVQLYEKEAFETKEFAAQQERYPYFLAGALVCLLLEWLL